MFSYNLQPNEKLLHFYRQSESLLMKPTIVVMLLIYLPIWFLMKYDLLGNFAWILAAWTLVLLIYALVKYFFWLTNTYLITNKRIVAVRYQSFFQKQIHELPVADISNIKQQSTGIFSSLMGYGTLEVEGRGSSAVVLEHIARPTEVKDMLWQLREGPNHQVVEVPRMHKPEY